MKRLKKEDFHNSYEYKAYIDDLFEAMTIFREASYQSHNGHWDKEGTHGVNCPECIRARALREKAEAILTRTK